MNASKILSITALTAAVGVGWAERSPEPGREKADSSDGSVIVREMAASASVFPEPVTILVENPLETPKGSSVNGATMLSQTFTPGKDFKLGAVFLAFSTAAASPPDSFRVRIQQVPDPAARTYPEENNLLGTIPASFSLSNTEGSVKALKIAFEGAAQIPFAAGKTYAIEISSKGPAATFYRRGSDNYSGGALYANRSAWNFPKTRDLAIGVVKAGGADGTILAGSSARPIPGPFGLQMLNGDATTDAQKDQAAAVGFQFFRKGVYWDIVEKKADVYDFSDPNADPLIKGFLQRGLQFYVTLYNGNPLYGEPAREVLTAQGREGFAKFAQAVARQYPSARHFEIWNEPNHAFFWKTQPSVRPYVDLVSVVAPAIKKARPDALVAGPATAGPGVPFDWLEQAFQKGLLENIDWVCIHPYRGAAVPPETVIPEYAQVRAYIEEYKPKGKQIDIVTGEWGYHSDKTPNGGTREVQAQYAARMFLLNLYAGMPFFSWYSWRDNAPTIDEKENYGIVTHDFQPKPSYVALKTLAETLAGYSYQQRIPHDDPNVWILKFGNAADQQAYAIWTAGQDSEVQIPAAPGAGNLSAMDGKTRSISWEDAGPKITATQSPQYLLIN